MACSATSTTISLAWYSLPFAHSLLLSHQRIYHAKYCIGSDAHRFFTPLKLWPTPCWTRLLLLLVILFAALLPFLALLLERGREYSREYEVLVMGSMYFKVHRAHTNIHATFPSAWIDRLFRSLFGGEVSCAVWKIIIVWSKSNVFGVGFFKEIPSRVAVQCCTVEHGKKWDATGAHTCRQWSHLCHRGQCD